MTLDDLTTTLDTLGIALSARLVVDAPRAVLTYEIKAALAHHKPALLLRLARRAQWEQLQTQRWGPADCDPAPRIIIDRPDPARISATLRDAASDDPYAVAERMAIRTEHEGPTNSLFQEKRQI